MCTVYDIVKRPSGSAPTLFIALHYLVIDTTDVFDVNCLFTLAANDYQWYTSMHHWFCSAQHSCTQCPTCWFYRLVGCDCYCGFTNDHTVGPNSMSSSICPWAVSCYLNPRATNNNVWI